MPLLALALPPPSPLSGAASAQDGPAGALVGLLPSAEATGVTLEVWEKWLHRPGPGDGLEGAPLTQPLSPGGPSFLGPQPTPGPYAVDPLH